MLKRLFYNKSIHKFNRISFSIATLLTSIFVSIALFNAYVEHQNDIIKIEKDYFNSQKDFVKKETKRALKYIQYKYEKDKDTKSLKALQEEIIDAIEQMRNITDGSGYVFIYDFDGVNIADPILKQNAGKNLIDFTDPNGKKVIKELIEISKKEDGGYVQYVWNKPITNTLEAKISYAHSFDELNWMVGSGVYLDEIQKVLNKRKDEYSDKVLTYLIEILFISLLLFIMGTLIYRYFTILIQNDIEVIKNTLTSFDVIDLRKLTFREFRTVSKNINTMTDELKYLNNNLEQKVKGRTKNLQKSKKYALKLVEDQDKFIQNAIHEINTPLSIIISNIDLFKLKYDENRYLTKIEAGSKIIHNIYNDLSYLIKKDRIIYKKEKINFSHFISNRIEFFYEVALGNNLKIKSNICDDIFVNFNETQLQRICDNSLSNAIKYSYENSTIIIDLTKEDDLIYLSIKNESNTIKDVKKLFKRYYRENDVRGGFGIGLNIIKEITELNHVIIDIQSENNITIFKYGFKDIF